MKRRYEEENKRKIRKELKKILHFGEIGHFNEGLYSRKRE